MIISIASGKGGTGKTTVATNLAVSLGSDVQILDCDVEEPNSHLFIQPTIEEVETITTPVPEVDMEKCSLCGKCGELGVIERGHRNGIEFVHGKLRVGEAMSPPLIRKVRGYARPGILTISVQ